MKRGLEMKLRTKEVFLELDKSGALSFTYIVASFDYKARKSHR